jgi:hypothetical protein
VVWEVVCLRCEMEGGWEVGGFGEICFHLPTKVIAYKLILTI